MKGEFFYCKHLIFWGVENVFPPLSSPPGPSIGQDWNLNGCEEKRRIGWHSLLSGCKVPAGTRCCCQFPHSWHLTIFHFHGCIFDFLRSQFFYWWDAVNLERSCCQRKIIFKKIIKCFTNEISDIFVWLSSLHKYNHWLKLHLMICQF